MPPQYRLRLSDFPPQTHIVEALGCLVRAGKIEDCEYLNVESEFGAMSVAIGASAAGARAYTATASQGLLFMAEAIYNASGLGLPIVMTVANRAIGAPINIWNDQSDSLSLSATAAGCSCSLKTIRKRSIFIFRLSVSPKSCRSP